MIVLVLLLLVLVPIGLLGLGGLAILAHDAPKPERPAPGLDLSRRIR